MTSNESTGSPRSMTARQKRSTSTVVLPVPAPAETKTSPDASIARCCSGLGLRALIFSTPGKVARACRRPLDLGPELVLWQVVVGDKAGHPVITRHFTQESARRPLPRQRPVDTPERLDADEIPKHEHIEREL